MTATTRELGLSSTGTFSGPEPHGIMHVAVIGRVTGQPNMRRWFKASAGRVPSSVLTSLPNQKVHI